MKTTLVIEIDSDKPLPEGVTDIAANRLYMWACAHGAKCAEVTGRILSQIEIDALRKANEQQEKSGSALDRKAVSQQQDEIDDA